MKRIRMEKAYKWFADSENTPGDGTPVGCDIARRQFVDYDSMGKVPTEPMKYFMHLLQGKRWFNLQRTTYYEMYIEGTWWGWSQLKDDWKDDLWLLWELTSWYPKLTGRELPR